MAGYGEQEGPRGRESWLAEQQPSRPVPHQPHQQPVPRQRASRLWRAQTLRASGPLARLWRTAPTERAGAGRAGAGQEAATGPGASPDPGGHPDPGGRTGPSGGADARPPLTSAAELRELAELGDLLAELAALVQDLGGLILGLMTAATRSGDQRVRTFTLPPDLADLAAAHQELKSEQAALNARFEASGASRNDEDKDRAALRASLARLTERAGRAVAAAAAVSFPGVLAVGVPEGDERRLQPDGTDDSRGDDRIVGTPSGQAPPPGEPGSPSREETGVPVSPGGTTPHTLQGTAQWRGGSVADRRLAPVAVALDAPDIDVAAHWATLVTPHVSTVKIGLELYLRYGPTVVATVRGGSGVRVFLDLKLHDIPNTVAGAARAVAKLHPEILTVHAAGGADMIKAAVEAAPDTIVAGVTLLTSISDQDLADLGVNGSVSDAVRRMAVLSVSAGARGLVCSPQEVAAVRAEVGPGILLITPGIRPARATSDDQARVATPEEALKAGADLLVIGRPITRAPDPGAAAAAIASSLRRAVPAS